MKASRLIQCLPLFCAGLFLQACDTTLNVKSPESSFFIKYFGNEGSQTGADFVVNTDGTFVLFGTTQKNGGEQRFYLVKADANGNLMWQRTFGTTKCQARDVILTKDQTRIVVLGNMVAPGFTDSDILLEAFDQNGAPIPGDSLLKNYMDVTSAPARANDNASTVTETNDGFIVAGFSGNLTHPGDPTFTRDPIFMRVDPHFQKYIPTWSDVPSNSQAPQSAATKIVQLPDLKFYVFGYTTYDSNLGIITDFNFWYYEMGLTGDPVSQPRYPGTAGNDEKLFSVLADTTSTGPGFFLVGLQSGSSGERIYYTRLIHPPLSFTDFDSGPIPANTLDIDLGNLGSILNPPNPSNEWVSACRANDGGYLILTNEATQGNNNLFLTKIASNGGQLSTNPSWRVPIIYGGTGDDFAGNVQQLPDGKIVIIGTMTVGTASANSAETKMVLIKTNENGQLSN